MAEHKAHELLRKNNISVEDIREGRTTLHHLRRIVHNENQTFDVFREMVKLRR